MNYKTFPIDVSPADTIPVEITVNDYGDGHKQVICETPAGIRFKVGRQFDGLDYGEKKIWLFYEDWRSSYFLAFSDPELDLAKLRKQLRMFELEFEFKGTWREKSK